MPTSATCHSVRRERSRARATAQDETVPRIFAVMTATFSALLSSSRRALSSSLKTPTLMQPASAVSAASLA